MARKRDQFGATEPVGFTSSEVRFRENMYPIRKRSKANRIWARVLAWSVPVFFVVGAVVIVGQGNQARISADRAAEAAEMAYNPSFKVRYGELGTQIIANWYSGREPVVSYLSGVTWPTTATPVEGPSLTNPALVSDGDELPALIGNITLVNGVQTKAVLDNGQKSELKDPYQEVLTYYMTMNNVPVFVSVQLLIPDLNDYASPPVLMTPPTITPVTSTVSSKDGFSTNPSSSGMESVSLSQDARDTLDNWAAAWAEDDQSDLKRLSQDSNTDRKYFGLGNWTLDGTVEVNWAYQKLVGSTDVVVVEVRFTISQDIPYTVPKEDGTEETIIQNFKSTQVMNVLLTDWESGLPGVVSWGPSGTWYNLEPYSVGTLSDITDLPGSNNGNVNPTQTPSPTPSPTETEDGEE